MIDKNKIPMVYTEVLEFIKHLPQKERDMIPENLMVTFEEHCDKTYDFHIEPQKMLEGEERLLKESYAFIGFLYREYWASDEQSKKYDKILEKNDKKAKHFLISVFVKQCYENLIDTAQNCKDGILPIRVNFILDEFANFPRIADMPAMISAARSRNIRFVLVVQSKQQLYAEYGDDAETIKSNCKNWIYLSCRELNLLKEIEELCGTVEVDGREYPLLTITQLQRLQVGWEDSQALVLRSGIAPYISWVKDFSVYPQVGYEAYRFPIVQHEKANCFSVLRCVHDKLAKELEETSDAPSLDDLFDD